MTMMTKKTIELPRRAFKLRPSFIVNDDLENATSQRCQEDLVITLQGHFEAAQGFWDLEVRESIRGMWRRP